MTFSFKTEGRSLFIVAHGIIDISSQVELPISTSDGSVVEKEARLLELEVLSLMEAQLKEMKERIWQNNTNFNVTNVKSLTKLKKD